ncbi:MAG: TetR/AcrR family transcriptional regulator [Sphaerochaetaceae bacterium]|nr:TetR/AcrR family transcriptional regulator [Sphaerochaetaceae bacterium]MDC7238168.1 TetR/AcrR family transcriptional regulator [Sphaerochaetaceae bacterium]
MNTQLRMNKEDRKKQICNIARKIFVEKGLENTTMKDIMLASNISVGGLYHHYKNVNEILIDTINYSYNYKNKLFSSMLKQYPKKNIESLVIDLTIELLFDKSDYSVLYVLLLIGSKKSSVLKHYYEDRKETSTKEFLNFLDDISKYGDVSSLRCLRDEAFISFFNSIMIGNYYRNSTNNLNEQKQLYKEYIRFYISKN